MRSQLSQYCEQFDKTVRPLLEQLDAALAKLRSTPAERLSSAVRDAFEETRTLLAGLIDKVGDQQAYVLIFGPLKSGKSTLMNALSGAYVSEVSSLPAYPCLVFVRDGAERAYGLTNYEGAGERITSADTLRTKIEEAHGDLVDHIRRAERTGESFDPVEHFPAAIHRIDVALPAPALRRSGAVLVDTPGLYTRMRFGYDRMTREFRNAAACAVFVVKTDNLFLEQVFTEFHQLLELFSRIFLVVNVDTTKRDVGPAGELVPSVEQHSPQRIIEAFENFAMSAPLKQAAADGRLRLYPVDLLHAASAVLKEPDSKRDAAADKNDKRTAKEKPGRDRVPNSFEVFRKDLETYLASADYLVAFLTDSLQRAHGLAGDIHALATHESIEGMRAEAVELEGRCAAGEEDLETIAACLSRDWDPAFEAAHKELEAEVVRRARDDGGRVARTMGAAIDTWSLSSHSLHHLIAGEWSPLLRDFQAGIDTEARRCAEQSVAASDAGMQLEPEVREFLAALEIDVRALRRAALERTPPAKPSPESLVPVDCEQIPIRRGVLDLMTLRSERSVRVKLFGPRERPDKKIPARIKKTRLGEPAHNYLRETLMRFRKEVFPRYLREALTRYTDDLRAATVEALRDALRAREPRIRTRIERFGAERRQLQQLLAPLEQLAQRADDTRSKVYALSKQYEKTVPDLLQRDSDERSGHSVLPAAAPRPPRREAGGRRRRRHSER